jgi:hypothetical protein
MSMSQELKWAQGKHGRWQSAQGGLTLFVAQEINGWIFWSAHTKRWGAPYAAIEFGLPSREAAMVIAQAWFTARG